MPSPAAALPCEAQLQALALCERRHPRERDLVCKVRGEGEDRAEKKKKKKKKKRGKKASILISFSKTIVSPRPRRHHQQQKTKSRSGPQRRGGLVPAQATLPDRGGRPRRVLRVFKKKYKATPGPASERAAGVQGRGGEARGLSRASERGRRRRRRKMSELCFFLFLHARRNE